MQEKETSSEKPSYESAFYIVPTHIRKLKGMSLVFLDVYETIFQFWNHGKPCFLSNKMIMKRTGHSATTVRDALIFFEKNNEMVRKIEGGKRYIVQPERKIEEPIEQEEKLLTPPRATALPPPRHGATPPRATALHNNNNTNNKNFNKKHRYADKNINNKIFSDVTNQSTSYKEDNTVYESKPEVRDKARKEILKTLGINRQEKKRESQPFYDKSGNPPF